jgi:chromosomal replication initiation ATPase DnaA
MTLRLYFYGRGQSSGHTWLLHASFPFKKKHAKNAIEKYSAAEKSAFAASCRLDLQTACPA